jgi:hypothetical protein
LAGGFFLELSLQPLAHPIAPFGQNFHFDIAQGAQFWVLRGHRHSLSMHCLFSDEEPYCLDYGGGVKMRPAA